MFMIEKNAGSGYKLIDKGAGIYQLRTPRGAYTGNLEQVCAYSVLKLGFDIEEIELGVMIMEKEFHNCAEYGILKKFMFTTDLNESSTRH